MRRSEFHPRSGQRWADGAPSTGKPLLFVTHGLDVRVSFRRGLPGNAGWVPFLPFFLGPDPSDGPVEAVPDVLKAPPKSAGWASTLQFTCPLWCRPDPCRGSLSLPSRSAALEGGPVLLRGLQRWVQRVQPIGGNGAVKTPRRSL